MDPSIKMALGLELLLYRQKMFQRSINFNSTNFAQISRLNAKPWSLELGAKCVEIKGESELVLKQLTKEYKCAKENLIMYYTAANALLKRFTHVEIQHVPRMENQKVNDLAQTASGYKASKEQLQEPIEIKNKRSSREAPSKKLLIPKLGGQKGLTDTHKVRIWLKFLLLTI